jgi:hypothetical protein
VRRSRLARLGSLRLAVDAAEQLEGAFNNCATYDGQICGQRVARVYQR